MEDKQMIINDFGITFSTVNGSGSTTANNTILKAIYKMGIPVSARNIFPSNIQGMPTWYSIRVSKEGFLGRLEKDDILVEMNSTTVAQNIHKIKSNGVLLINESINYPEDTSNIFIYRMPVDDLLKSCDIPANLSSYLANMVYVGTLAWLIDIDLVTIESALDQHFHGKRSAVDINFRVVIKSFEWASENITKEDSYQLKSLDLTNGKIMVDGNTASALGALYGGLQFAAWYPITPATSLAESINEYIPILRTDPENGIANCAVLQAEDELAAIGMVVGAGWAGLRSMTSTSGPGLCLMAEFLGLAYFAEIPLVVCDVQRVGPSTGLPTHTSQSDLTFSYFISHGDKDMIILLPGNVNECFEFGWKALDIAEKLQTPVLILSDMELGMNIWMADPFKYPNTPIERGKILWEKGLENFIEKNKVEWGRYMDIDGDGIPFRTVPGNYHPKAAYFTRGTGHDEYAHYSEDAKDWEKKINRLHEKIMKAKGLIPSPEIFDDGQSKEGLISYGSSHMPTEESVKKFRNLGFKFGYMRIRGIPFNQEVEEFLEHHEKIFVVENNRDGQLKQILSVEFPHHAHKLIQISKCDGLSLSTEWIMNKIELSGIGKADG